MISSGWRVTGSGPFKFVCGTCLSQLAVFAAASVITAEGRLLLLYFGLAADTQANPGYGLAAGSRNNFFASFAMGRTFALGQPAPGKLYGVVYIGVDLFLNRPIAGPANGHDKLLPKNRFSNQ
jgi:hypothetical protein